MFYILPVLPGVSGGLLLPAILAIGTALPERRLWRVISGILLGLWISGYVFLALASGKKELLIYPMLFGFLWMVISEISKSCKWY
jgi:O-antigen ligase